LSKNEIEKLVEEHTKAPHLRTLQKRLAEEITVMVHSKDDLDNAQMATTILFGNSTSDDLKKLNEHTFLEVFEGVPQANVSREDLEDGLDMIAALSAKTSFLSSNGEARRELKQNSISVNKEKVSEDFLIKKSDLIKDRYVLLQRGKKNYFVLLVD
jgi:tyrosyl-tRNA synthetase